MTNFVMMAVSVLLMFSGVRLFALLIRAYDGRLTRDLLLKGAGGLALIAAGLCVIVLG